MITNCEHLLIFFEPSKLLINSLFVSLWTYLALEYTLQVAIHLLAIDILDEKISCK